VKRLAPLMLLAVLLVGACSGTDRPEGVVERWLISLNQGKAGEPGKYAPERLSQQILPHWESRDPGDLDVIEVGRGKEFRNSFGGNATPAWWIPFRIERASGVKLDGTAIAQRRGSDWHVTALRLGDRSLGVPSEGGQRIGSASAGAWAIAIGISAVLMFLVAFVIRLTPKPMALPTGKQEAGP
jgi:hypothetical protein